MDKETWACLEETLDFEREVKQLISTYTESLVNNKGLMGKSNEQIVKEYMYNSGLITGLQVLLEFIEECKNDRAN